MTLVRSPGVTRDAQSFRTGVHLASFVSVGASFTLRPFGCQGVPDNIKGNSPDAGVELPRYASIAFAAPRRFAGRVTYETASNPINATGIKTKAPSPAR